MEDNTLEGREILDFNKLQAKDGKLTIEHIEGTAAKLYEEGSVSITGAIQAPRKFIDVRKDQSVYERSNVQFSYEARTIELTTDEQFDNKGYIVKGVLNPNPKIAELKINANTLMDAKALSQLLKFNRALFQDKGQCTAIVEQLIRLKVNAEKTIEATDTGRGDRKDLYEVSVKNSNIELFFILEMPVFVGQPSKPVKVDIGFNVREKHVEFWLESVELKELLDNDTKAIIDAEVAAFPAEIVVIEK